MSQLEFVDDWFCTFCRTYFSDVNDYRNHIVEEWLAGEVNELAYPEKFWESELRI